MKVRDIIRRLGREGWYEARVTGDHRIFKHPSKVGIVVVSGHLGKDLPVGTVKHIFEQAGWED